MTESLMVKFVADTRPYEQAMGRMNAISRRGFEAVALMEARVGTGFQKATAAAIELGLKLEGISEASAGAAASARNTLDLITTAAQSATDATKSMNDSIARSGDTSERVSLATGSDNVPKPGIWAGVKKYISDSAALLIHGLSRFSLGHAEPPMGAVGAGAVSFGAGLAASALGASNPVSAAISALAGIGTAIAQWKDSDKDFQERIAEIKQEMNRPSDEATAKWFGMSYEDFRLLSPEARQIGLSNYAQAMRRPEQMPENLQQYKANLVELMRRRTPGSARRAELETMLNVMSGDNIGQPGSSPQQLLEPMSFQGFGSGGIVQQAFLRLPQDSAQVVDAIDGASQSVIRLGDTTEAMFSLCGDSLLGYSTDFVLRTQDQEQAYSLLNTGITESSRIATTTMGLDWQDFAGDLGVQFQTINADYQAGQDEQQEATRQTAEAVREIQADSFSDFLRQDRETTDEYLDNLRRQEQAADRTTEATTGLYADSAETCLALDEAKTGQLIANQERYVDECGESFQLYEQAWSNTLSRMADLFADFLSGNKIDLANFLDTVRRMFIQAFSQDLVNRVFGAVFGRDAQGRVRGPIDLVLSLFQGGSGGTESIFSRLGSWLSRGWSWLSGLFGGTAVPGEIALTAGGPVGGLGAAAI